MKWRILIPAGFAASFLFWHGATGRAADVAPELFTAALRRMPRRRPLRRMGPALLPETSRACASRKPPR
jgi:hypothetical protein